MPSPPASGQSRLSNGMSQFSLFLATLSGGGALVPVVAAVRKYFVASAANWLASPMLDRLVARVARQHGLALDDLPDLTQETRIALWEPGVDQPVSTSLVLSIASNKAVDLIRRRVRRRARERATTLLARRRDGDTELHHLLNVQVEALPPRLRKFYELHYHQGLSEREVARTLSLCRASVRWLDHQLLRVMAAGVRSGPRSRIAR